MRRGIVTAFSSVAATGALLAACSSSPKATSSCTDGFDVLVAASDYTAASKVGGFTLGGCAALPYAGIDLGKDPALVAASGRAFFVARDQDLVFELDPKTAEPIAETSTSDPSYPGYANPQDVGVASDGALWVPRFNVPSLLVVPPTHDGGVPIDLSSQDPDGNPNMSAVAVTTVDGAEKAYVALERLDDVKDAQGNVLVSRLPSFLARVDVATKTVEATATLLGRNPFGTIERANEAFYFAAPGNFNDASEPAAGIERFDPSTFTSSWLLAEGDLGASVTTVAVNGGCGAAIVADATPNVNATSLVTFDAIAGKALTTAKNAPLSTSGFDLAGLSWKGDVLAVGDRRPSPANGRFPIHLFDRTGACDLTMRPDTIFFDVPPVALRSP
ncbi:MAG TPA: hypothetical protein VF407_17200 [Polyangiaceae bacterium]